MDFYFRNSLATSTPRSYSSAGKRYSQFCNKFGFPLLPVSEPQLCRYVSYLAEEGISHTSIKCYISAIRRMQIAHALPNPVMSNMPKLEAVVKGIKLQQAKKRDTTKLRLPITPSILLRLRSVWERNSEDHESIMLWAACCVCFFGFMRAGEITVPSQTAYDAGVHMNFGDVSVDDILKPAMISLQLKSSKTDPFRKGVNIVLGRTHTALCPVEALLAYLAIRGNEDGFLFQFKDGRLLSKNLFVSKVREALRLAGLDSHDYAGHSFRIGAATTASECGINEYTIKMLGRWQSSAYQLYIRTPREQLARFSAIISSVPAQRK